MKMGTFRELGEGRKQVFAGPLSSTPVLRHSTISYPSARVHAHAGAPESIYPCRQPGLSLSLGLRIFLRLTIIASASPP